MQEKEKSLCFSGHRSEKLPKDKEKLDSLKLKLSKEIDLALKNGMDTFYFGACYGFDLLCAEIILMKKRAINFIGSQIKLIAVVPFEEQAKNWNEKSREQYYKILAESDDVIIMQTRYRQGCYYARNRFMVDQCTKIICYYDGGAGGTAYTVKYAKENNLQIINLY